MLVGKAKALEPTSRLSSPPFWPVASPFKKRNMKSRDSRTNNPHKPQIPSFQAPFCCLNKTRDSRAQSAQHGPQPSLHTQSAGHQPQPHALNLQHTAVPLATRTKLRHTRRPSTQPATHRPQPASRAPNLHTQSAAPPTVKA